MKNTTEKKPRNRSAELSHGGFFILDGLHAFLSDLQLLVRPTCGAPGTALIWLGSIEVALPSLPDRLAGSAAESQSLHWDPLEAQLRHTAPVPVGLAPIVEPAGILP